jgi:hypothetical protein
MSAIFVAETEELSGEVLHIESCPGCCAPVKERGVEKRATAAINEVEVGSQSPFSDGLVGGRAMEGN